jgi:hypothetical protein
VKISALGENGTPGRLFEANYGADLRTADPARRMTQGPSERMIGSFKAEFLKETSGKTSVRYQAKQGLLILYAIEKIRFQGTDITQYTESYVRRKDPRL